MARDEGEPGYAGALRPALAPSSRETHARDNCVEHNMVKRSNFERREADFYPTPRAAVLPLIPYLRGIRTFAEPCCGDGALVRHLESFGLRCVYAGDIRSGQDALA